MNPRKNELSPVFNRNMYHLKPPETDKKKWKIFITSYDKASKLKIYPYPIELDIELNSTCNLKCKHCIHSIQDRGNFIMDWDKIKKETHKIGLARKDSLKDESLIAIYNKYKGQDI